jgi:hypothetical protein
MTVPKKSEWFWVKLSNNFVNDPKIVAAGEAAGWLYVAGLCYSGTHLTDGVIPKKTVNLLVDKNGIARANRLVEVGLWEVLDKDTYLVHNYSVHQNTSEDIDEKREEWRKRQAAWRAIKANKKLGEANLKKHAAQVESTTIETIRENLLKNAERCYVDGDAILSISKYSELYNIKIPEALVKYEGAKGLGSGDALRNMVVHHAASKYLGRELSNSEKNNWSALRKSFGFAVIANTPKACIKASGDPIRYLTGILNNKAAA